MTLEEIYEGIKQLAKLHNRSINGEIVHLMEQAIKAHTEKSEAEKHQWVALQKAYDMGTDCEMNGATEENCHFTLFSSHAKMKAWEQGKKDAKKQKEQA